LQRPAARSAGGLFSDNSQEASSTLKWGASAIFCCLRCLPFRAIHRALCHIDATDSSEPFAVCRNTAQFRQINLGQRKLAVLQEHHTIRLSRPLLRLVSWRRSWQAIHRAPMQIPSTTKFSLMHTAICRTQDWREGCRNCSLWLPPLV
jgi:hypothetical protein